jgi:hypothetical protein
MLDEVLDLTGGAGSRIFLFSDRQTLAAAGNDPLKAQWINGKGEINHAKWGIASGCFFVRLRAVFLRPGLISHDAPRTAKVKVGRGPPRTHPLTAALWIK